MADLKDFIPKGNDENSGDSWFVLSSASEEEEEDDEPEMKKPNIAQVSSNEKAIEKKENEPTDKKPELQQLDNSQEPMQVDENKENGPTDEKKNIEQSKEIQIVTAEEKENDPVVKQPEVEKLEYLQKEIDEKKENDSGDKEPKIEKGKISQEKIVGEITGMEKTEEKQKETEQKTGMEKTEEKQKETEQKNNTECKTTTVKDMQRQKETMMAEAEKAVMMKQKRKPKSLLMNEEGHSEIALEVHALRETLIQLSLNLSSTEEEKYNAITSEVQALRETVTQLNNDLSNRVSQIEARSEQVHTLLCRFIMTRCGSYKEPPSKGNYANTSDMAVQTENSVFSEYDQMSNEDKEALPVTNIGTMGDTKMSQSEPSSINRDSPFNEQSEICGLKRPRLDDDPSQVSEEPSSHISETSGESMYASVSPSRRHELNKFPKGRRRNRRLRSKHPGTPAEHNFREPFNQYQHQTQLYNANQELAELAYRYSSEGANYWRKNRSNNPWTPGGNRKHPYSNQMQEEQGSNRFPGELDEYMDKVIDEWAQDEDD